MNPFSPSAMSSIKSWISDAKAHPVFFVPVIKPFAAFMADDEVSDPTEPAFTKRTVERRKMVFPAPWTGETELIYSAWVAVYEDTPIACAPGTLHDTERPWYDPASWWVPPHIAQYRWPK